MALAVAIVVGVVLGWALMIAAAWSGATLMFPPFAGCLNQILKMEPRRAILLGPFLFVAAMAIITAWALVVGGALWIAFNAVDALYKALQ